MFGPMGMFANHNDQLVPVTAFIPLIRALVFGIDGQITKNDSNKLPKPVDLDPVFANVAEIDQKAIAKILSEIREKIQQISDKYDVRLTGVVHFGQKIPFTGETQVVASAAFLNRPLESITLSVSDGTIEQNEELLVFTNGEIRGTVKSGGKSLKIPVSRGKNEIHVVSGGRSSPHFLFDVLEETKCIIEDNGQAPGLNIRNITTSKAHPSICALLTCSPKILPTEMIVWWSKGARYGTETSYRRADHWDLASS